jgi:hypothetical protein
MMALTLSVPCADWLTPCEYSVTTRGVARRTSGRSARRPARRGRSQRGARRCCRRCCARARAHRQSPWCGARCSRGRARRVGEMHQQPAEQRGVGAGLQSQKQIGIAPSVRRGSITTMRRRAPLLVGQHALEQHRMAPGGVRADQHQQIGLVEVLVAARHGVGAEGAAVAGDRRGHAQPRIGVDIGAADESLHQLVGDVIVLGQQLAGEIERDRAGPSRAMMC